MKREEKIERVIRIVWDSLESHLSYTYREINKNCKYCKKENRKFHKECVRDYAIAIKLLSELL